MAQQELFDGGVEQTAPTRRRAMTRPASASRRHTDEARHPIEVAVARLVAASDLLDRARFAAELRDLAADAVASSIRDASRAGKTWREIGAALNVPFQTLHRRYGEKY